MDNLKSLGRGLPPTSVDSSLAQEFRNAANAVTKLYKLSNEKAVVSRQEGYKQCLSDVLGFLQQHQLRHEERLRRDGEAEGESGDLAHELWKWVTRKEEEVDDELEVAGGGAGGATAAAAASSAAGASSGANASGAGTSGSVGGVGAGGTSQGTTGPGASNTNSSYASSSPSSHIHASTSTTDLAPSLDVFRHSFSLDSYPGYSAVRRKGHSHGHVYHHNNEDESDDEDCNKKMRLV